MSPIALGLHGLGVGPPGDYAKLLLNMPGVYALWPQWETEGSICHCLTDPAMNGQYTGVNLANDLGPFGWKAPFYDGANDYADVLTTALQSALNGSEGTLLQWLRIADAATWTDGNVRASFWTEDTEDWEEAIHISKSADNTMRGLYKAGGVADGVIVGGQTDLIWLPWVMTWSASADELKFFKNGVQIGTTQDTLGTWSGDVDVTTIGARNSTPEYPWKGWLGPVVLANVVWTPAQVKRASLA